MSPLENWKGIGELSDAFFNCQEVEEIRLGDIEWNDRYGGPKLREACERYKAREFHPWSVERLCADYLLRV